MLDTFSIFTLHLATAYGVGILVVAMSAITGPARLGAVIADFERSPALLFLGALLALVMGIALVMLHNLWTDPAAGLVSLLGWVILLKGIFVAAAPEGLMKFASAAASSPARVRVWGFIALILAALYLAVGLIGRASVSL
jgi:hypothetical protein